MRRTWIIGILGILVLGSLASWTLTRPPARPEIRANVVGLGTPAGQAGFARAVEARRLEFPVDHGPHPDYQTEWWYYTGNVQDAAGRHFGYQLTFFRRALTPQAVSRASDWGSNQVYMAHLALTDTAGGKHLSFERFSRGAAGLSGASPTPYHVWLESWQVEELAPGGGKVHLRADQGPVALDLTLTALKPPAAHGRNGLSPKSEAPGNASYYYSLTRLATEGTVTVDGRAFSVTGLSWMDHEWSTSALGKDAVGWDWFSLQLDDGREVMYFQIRRSNGTTEPVSSGSLVEPDGRVLPLRREDVMVKVLDQWPSPTTQARYPARWQLVVPGLGLVLDVEPTLADQEMKVSFAYWEGAVRVRGTADGRPVAGEGYVELTGYAGSMQGQF